MIHFKKGIAKSQSYGSHVVIVHCYMNDIRGFEDFSGHVKIGILNGHERPLLFVNPLTASLIAGRTLSPSGNFVTGSRSFIMT